MFVGFLVEDLKLVTDSENDGCWENGVYATDQNKAKTQ
jgi:hypothetical protein